MSELILHPTEDTFDQMLQDNPVALVDFWATWCAPCRMVAPVIEQIAQKYEGRLAVAKVDIDEQAALAARYGVQSIPTVLLFKDGKLVSTEIGAKPLAAYTGLIDKHL